MTIKKQKANNLLLSISGVLIGFSILILLVWFGIKMEFFSNGYYSDSPKGQMQMALREFYEITQSLNLLINNLTISEKLTTSDLEFLNSIKGHTNNSYVFIWDLINELDSSIYDRLNALSQEWSQFLNQNTENFDFENIVPRSVDVLREISSNLANLNIENEFILNHTLLDLAPIVYFVGIILAIFNFSMRSKSSENVKTSNVVWTINLIGMLIIALFGLVMIIYWILNMFQTWNRFDYRNTAEVNTGLFIGVILLATTIILWIPYLSIYKQKSELIENVAPLNTNLGAVNNNNVVIEQPVNISTNPVESSEVVETAGEDAKWTVGKKLVFAGSITTIVLAAISLITISIISLPLLIIYFIPGMFMYPALIASLVLGIIILKSIKKNTNSNKLNLIAGIIIIATGFIGSIFTIMWYSWLFGAFIPPMVIGGVLILVGSLIKN